MKKKDLFYRLASWVDGRLQLRKACCKKKTPGIFWIQQQKELALCERIYGKKAAAEQYRIYRIDRGRKLLMTGILGCMLAMLLIGWSLCKDRSVTALLRPEAAQEDAEYTLWAKLGEQKLGEILLEVPRRQLPKGACEELLTQAQELLPDMILGENTSLDRIQKDLVLPKLLCEGLVEVHWESSCFELLDTDGKVKNESLAAASVVTLTARMICQQQERSLCFPVQIIPPAYDTAQRLSQEIAGMLKEEGQMQKQQEWFKLPDTFENETLSWSFEQKPYGLWILLLTVCGCAGIYMGSIQDLQKEEQKQKEQLLQEYPGFLARLAMLAGTGMPVRVIFERLGEEYREDDKLLYREIRHACREMESGVTQADAYTNWGKRCRLHEYKKCAALLNQHIKRGAGGFLDTLWLEAENACEERRARARQSGDTAQTKLLFPMMLMLLTVMVLIMVPACFSFAGM